MSHLQYENTLYQIQIISECLNLMFYNRITKQQSKMFTDLVNTQTNQSSMLAGQEKVNHYYGVDLSSYQCYKLMPDPLYSTYQKDDLHFAITAIQKGTKPPSKIGIKRTKKRNHKRKLKIQVLKATKRHQVKYNNIIQPNPAYIKPINPKSPEEICLKALRKQFLELIAPNTMEDQTSIKSPSIKKKRTQEQKNAARKPKFIRKKQNQVKRRLQLSLLIKNNQVVLQSIFGEQKLRRFGKNSKGPKVGRKQIKQALIKHYQQMVKSINDQQEIRKIIDEKLEERKRNFHRFQRNHSQEYNEGSKFEEQRLLSDQNSQDQEDDYSQKSRSIHSENSQKSAN